VKTDGFEELLASVRQTGDIRRGALKPARVTKFKPAYVKALRSTLGRSKLEPSPRRAPLDVETSEGR
jgi:hypothetical protein